MSARVCFVVGARPNFMKSAPVYRELAALDPSLELLLLHTGQHYDDAMSDVFFRELGMPRPDEFLAVGSGSHAEQTAKVLVGVERVLLEHEIDLCVVAGDVNSTIAAALAAVKLGIPIAHIEAGLRSFDRAMPEEHNRVLTDHLSDILLAHSEEAITNLQREGITSGVHLVGNTMIDTLLEHLDKARERQSWEQFGLHPGEYALVTLHRPALVDDPAKLTAVTDGLITLARDHPVLFPVHPRTLRNLESTGDDARLRDSGVLATEPQGYLDFLCLEADAAFVLTDSGGDPGGDDGARRPLLHAPRLDRAARDGGARHEHRSRREAGADRRDPAAARAAEARRRDPRLGRPRRRARGRDPAGVPQRLIVAS